MPGNLGEFETLVLIALGLVTAEQFDQWVDAKKMTEPGE